MRTITFWLSLGMIFVIPWENMVYIDAVGRVSKAVGFLLAAFWVATVLVTGGFRKLRPVHLVVLLFVLWSAMSILWSVDVDKTIQRSLTYFQMFVLVVILWDIYTTPAALRAALQVYILGAFVAIESIFSDYFLGSGELRRYTVSGFNPNAVGFTVAMGMPLAWYLALFEDYYRKTHWLRWVNYAYIPAAFLAIGLTASRAAFLGTLLFLLFMFGTLTQVKLYKRVLLFAILVASLSAVLPLIPQNSIQRFAATSDAVTKVTEGGGDPRLGRWRESIDVFVEHPILGIGSGAFYTVAEGGKTPHNFIVGLSVEVGIVGFGLFAIILSMAIYYAQSLPKWCSRLWLTVFMIWFIGAITHNWELKKHTWLFLGLVVANASLYKRRDSARMVKEVPFSLTDNRLRQPYKERYHRQMDRRHRNPRTPWKSHRHV